MTEINDAVLRLNKFGHAGSSEEAEYWTALTNFWYDADTLMGPDVLAVIQKEIITCLELAEEEWELVEIKTEYMKTEIYLKERE